jgi:mersacidin/lichenicidin family type 2 lantibiotic
MSTDTLIRAWKDPLFRSQLSDHEQTLLLEHPAGNADITDLEMGKFENSNLEIPGTCTLGTCTLGTCTLGTCTLGTCTLGTCTLAEE